MDNKYQNFLRTELHKVLRENMKRAGVRQIDLVNSTGLTQTYLSLILSGDRFPPLDTLLLICENIGVMPHEVLFTAYLRAFISRKPTGVS